MVKKSGTVWRASPHDSPARNASRSEAGGRQRVWRALSFAWQAGFVVVVPLGGALGVGLWLDSRFQTTPLFLLAGSVLGIILATVLLVKKAMRVI